MRLIILTALIMLMTACDSDRHFEEFNEVNGSWALGDSQEFIFDIQDASIEYQLGGTVRNRKSYPYYNLYIKYELKKADEILINDLHEVILFEPKTGKPNGDGLGDVFDHSFTLEDQFQFDEPGEYSLRFTQFMRLDTLPDIERIGARVSYFNPE